jgi:hypothetical protein
LRKRNFVKNEQMLCPSGASALILRVLVVKQLKMPGKKRSRFSSNLATTELYVNNAFVVKNQLLTQS